MMMNIFGVIGIIGGGDGPTAIYTASSPISPDLSNALALGWKGMTGIFTVMVIIALIVWGLPKFSALFEKKEEKQNTEDE